MADDRPVLSPEEEIAQLRVDFEDMRSTLLARASRLPTGTTLPYFGATVGPDRLLLLGQTVLRADYPVLWQWANDSGAVINNFFEPGDGSTTFVLPDLRGKVLIGVGTDVWDTYSLAEAIGAARVTLAINEMPSHDHGVGSDAAGGHGHGNTNFIGNHQHARGGGNGFTNTVANHGGHCSGTSNVVPPGSGITLPSNYSGAAGSHNHTVAPGDASGGHDHTTASVGNHTHGIDILSTGSGAQHENRQPSLAVNWVIWT